MQTVTNGCVGRRREKRVRGASQRRRPHRVSRIEAKGVLRAMFNGDKTYDNRTGEYNSAEELL